MKPLILDNHTILEHYIYTALKKNSRANDSVLIHHEVSHQIPRILFGTISFHSKSKYKTHVKCTQQAIQNSKM